MFLLPRPDLPGQPDTLASALEDGLRAFVSRPEHMVSVRGNEIAALKGIDIDLSRGTVETVRPPLRPEFRQAEPAFSVGELSVKAEPLSVAGGQIAFNLQARDVEFQQARQRDEKILLFIRRAAWGQVNIDVQQKELERVIAGVAGRLAQKQGVTIEDVNLKLTQPQGRTLDAKVTLSARKLFFHAVLNLSGTISISDDLVATISNLSCRGEGAIASLACAAITPQFARVEGRPFPLSAVPLGEVQLREVAFSVTGERVTVSANFGESSHSSV